MSSIEQIEKKLDFSNRAYVEAVHAQWLEDPTTVPAEFDAFFKELSQLGGDDTSHDVHAGVQDSIRYGTAKHWPGESAAASVDGVAERHAEALVNAYRSWGHRGASLDPLGMHLGREPLELELSANGLDEADLALPLTGSHIGSIGAADTLRDLVSSLQRTYCGSVGWQFNAVEQDERRNWLIERIESAGWNRPFTSSDKRQLMRQLIAAEALEIYISRRYTGAKRFGIEGGEAFIPMLDAMISRLGQQGIKEICLGMPHRGRLNVLINIMGKMPLELFNEFEDSRDAIPEDIRDHTGDVKYHSGFSANVHTDGGPVHLALLFNPSHLEIVAPVVLGSARARMDKRNDASGDDVCPVVIHGDAAVAAQGVVLESLQMASTPAFGVGGTIHIVVNNQIGFTTSDPADARSTEYCTDVARLIGAPVFHVNADDPEACVRVTELAVDYRNRFKSDVFIDLVCYRRRGHNEADDPSMTDPRLYDAIGKHPTVTEVYGKQLEAQGDLKSNETSDWVDEHRAAMDSGENSGFVNQILPPETQLHLDWNRYLNNHWTDAADTSLSTDLFDRSSSALTSVPEDFTMHRSVGRTINQRAKMASGEVDANWGFAECLAYASLLGDGYPIRFTGQDCRRGTFGHRHLYVTERNTNQKFGFLDVDTGIQLGAGGIEEPMSLYDSLLSEEAVLGFEYGYSCTRPQGLVVWEAQFGDFANGAQVVIDQFIAAGQQKWERLSGLVMLLPHGLEGQGPEHSSARLERYLQLCANDNIQVVVPTTPGQMFHLLRRQAIRNLRIPLVVMTPKSLLRLPQAVTSKDTFLNGSFQLFFEHDKGFDESAEHLVICSGKVAYDLEAKIAEDPPALRTRVIRLEQLYPFPKRELVAHLRQTLPNLKVCSWVQEEAINQGAWFMIKHRLEQSVAEYEQQASSVVLRAVARRGTATPAVGSARLHALQQAELLNVALDVGAADTPSVVVAPS